MTFARFMELCLYHPELGYYERAKPGIGAQGDYYTSVSVGSLFGEMLGYQFLQWWQNAGQSWPFRIIEAGAHDGRLALDILNFLQAFQAGHDPGFEFWLLEPSLRRQSWQQATLHRFLNRVRWFKSWEYLPSDGLRGIIFCNELLDSFPVHRLGWDAATHAWFEWGVQWASGRLTWIRLPESRSNALELIEFHKQTAGFEISSELLDVLPDGFTIEVNPAAAHWWEQASRMLQQGFLLTLDYGLTNDQFLRAERLEGTIRAYHKHHLHSNVLDLPGEQDITSHINFSMLRALGEREGLTTCGLFTQAQFLTGIFKATIDKPGSFGEWTTSRVRQFQTLTHPEHLGRNFKVLVQCR